MGGKPGLDTGLQGGDGAVVGKDLFGNGWQRVGMVAVVIAINRGARGEELQCGPDHGHMALIVENGEQVTQALEGIVGKGLFIGKARVLAPEVNGSGMAFAENGIEHRAPKVFSDIMKNLPRLHFTVFVWHLPSLLKRLR
jgi:hypothetical protein